jgi:DNA-directed RNA polymerase subunit M/transcription elongation factor TFIIS
MVCNDIKKQYIMLQEFFTNDSKIITYNDLRYAEHEVNRKDIFTELSFLNNDIYLIEQIEKSIFEYSLCYVLNKKLSIELFSSIYYDKLHSIKDNLDTNNLSVNNKTLLSSMLSKNVDPKYIAFLTPQQLHPERWKKELDQHTRKEAAKYNVVSTDIYTCKKCKQKKSKISQLQTRSADEPMSTFVTCLVCYNTFVI